MTIFEEIVQIVPGLRPEEQRQVLDVVIKLRDAHKLPDITMPPVGADEAAWSAWRDQVSARSAIVMEEEKQRLLARGVIDEQWNLVTDELPEDMRPSSQTSVET